ncbi:MAG: class I SAM-dependent methyltransferase [Chlorobi bacterium]|nr:class I SAM-dependent methyltransferase [Chlorobiota bacterium]
MKNLTGKRNPYAPPKGRVFIGSGDFIFLTSVFTHMMPVDVSAYLDQISRVLKSGGKCFATFFIINEVSKRLMKENDGIKFNHKFNNYYLHTTKVKEANVAFDETFLEQMIKSKGLKIASKHYGYWSGRQKDKSVDFQDIYIIEK